MRPRRPSLPLQDPREAFYRHITHPGRFSEDTLLRALEMHARVRLTDDPALPTIHAEIVRAVEREIRSGALELEGDAYRQREQACWEHFLEHCHHYHRVCCGRFGRLGEE